MFGQWANILINLLDPCCPFPLTKLKGSEVNECNEGEIVYITEVNSDFTEIGYYFCNGINWVRLQDLCAETIINTSPSSQSDYDGVNISCNGGNDGIIYTASGNPSGGVGPYTWRLDGPNEYSEVQADDTNFINLEAGAYVLTAIDNQGCESEGESIILIESDLIEISAILTHPSTPGNNDGSINITITGGTVSPLYNPREYGFDYEWDHGPLSQNVTNLYSGTYHVTVTDSNGCEAEATFELIDPE